MIVQVAAAGSKTIIKVEISVDGEIIQSKSSAPYTFSINTDFGAGPHVLAAKATDINGKSADTSINITYNLGGLKFPTN